MVPALRLDKRIGPAAYLRPGLGVAGGNLERDLVTLQALCIEHQVDATYIDALIDYNAHRLDWVQRQLRQHVFKGDLRPQVGVWGLTYKKNTRSTKNSPSLRVIESIAERADVCAWDPAIGASDIDIHANVVDDAYAAVEGADCLLVMADWDQFADADLPRVKRTMRRPLVVDCVGILESRRAEMDGLEYVAMGR
jgi:UDPglucose 6-dehydrogenase